jgi:hypothetical protein
VEQKNKLNRKTKNNRPGNSNIVLNHINSDQ